MLGAVIAMAMVANLAVAGFIGAATPLVLERFGIDPAVAASIFLTTVTDVVGFFVFLALGRCSCSDVPGRRQASWRIRAKRSRSMLPPDSTRTTLRPAMRSRSRKRAAKGAAPAPSATLWVSVK